MTNHRVFGTFLVRTGGLFQRHIVSETTIPLSHLSYVSMAKSKGLFIKRYGIIFACSGGVVRFGPIKNGEEVYNTLVKVINSAEDRH